MHATLSQISAVAVTPRKEPRCAAHPVSDPPPILIAKLSDSGPWGASLYVYG
jgi:hypothetical protein